MSALASPSSHLISEATLIKQGAEAKIYALPSLYPEPQVYWPSSSSATSSSTSRPALPISSTAPSSAPASTPAPSTAPAPSSSSSSSPSHEPTPVILKHRFTKRYRHPSLDASLTRSRLAFEARALTRCARAGVSVPRVLWVDEGGGVLGLERIEGWSVREVLGGGAEGELETADEEEEEQEQEPELNSAEAEAEALAEVEAVVKVEVEKDEQVPSGGSGPDASLERGVDKLQLDGDQHVSEGMLALERIGVTHEHLMSSIGAALARLHTTAIVHGDLTTSNMMVRLTPTAADPYEIVLIDFGLSSTAQLAETYAVDLYVLERAFASTHPQSEALYAGVLESYARGLGEKKWTPIETKLKEVRLRGRKRDMTG